MGTGSGEAKLLFGMGGRRTPRIEVFLGCAEAPRSAPFMTAAELGFHPLSERLNEADDDGSVTMFANRTRQAIRGQYGGLFDTSDGSRFALVQDDRGPFYSNRNPNAAVAWRDWFHAAAFQLFTRLDDRWHSKDVVLAHPTGHGWGGDETLGGVMESFLEGLGHALDERSLTLQRIWVNPCCIHDQGAAMLRAAVVLQSSPCSPYRSLFCNEDVGDEIGIAKSPRVKIWRVELLAV